MDSINTVTTVVKGQNLLRLQFQDKRHGIRHNSPSVTFVNLPAQMLSKVCRLKVGSNLRERYSELSLKIWDVK